MMRVHRNLHAARQGTPQWVQTLRGRVVAYHPEIALSSVTTRIQPAGARACRQEQVRRVCAFLDGWPAGMAEYAGWTADELTGDPLWRRIVFDPRREDQFGLLNPWGAVDRFGFYSRWNAADMVLMLSDGSSWARRARWVP